GCGWFGSLGINCVFCLSLSLDDLISRAQARLRYCIQNLVEECHKKVALWFLTNFDIIIIPPFNGSAMSHRLNRKITKMVRKMLTWSHGRFRERLIFKAEELVEAD
ncbi:10845_t:CDS:2, partial [Gigaspora rosea]